METINLGRVAFVYKGDYSSLVSYNKFDVVFDGYSSYVSLVTNNIGNSLSNVYYWGALSKGQQILYGDTASRPLITSIGIQYFDTTINKPIWHNGSAWVDSLGATV